MTKVQPQEQDEDYGKDGKPTPQYLARLKAEAQARLNQPEPTTQELRTKARREAQAAATAKAKPVYQATVNLGSTRQLIRAALLQGQDTKQITAMLQVKKPGTAAAEKADRHIAFYRSKLRKEGLLAKPTR